MTRDKRGKNVGLAMGLAAGVLSVGGVAAAQPQITFQEAIDKALEQSLEIQAAAANAEAAGRRRSATNAQRYPLLQAEASLQRWNEALTVNFGGMDGDGGFTARDQITASTSVSLIQPLAGLIVLGRQVALDESVERQARAEVSSARLDAALAAAQTYLSVLKAQAVATVAEQAVNQLSEELRRAKARREAGALDTVDVLLLQAAQEAAAADAFRAQASVEVARLRLAVALNTEPQETPGVVDTFPEDPAPLTRSRQTTDAQTLESNPSLLVANERSEQARKGRKIASSEWLPSVSAIANYQQVRGQQFQPRNAWFIGATASWNFWLGLRTRSAVKEAEARATQAELQAENLRRQIILQARSLLIEAKAAFASLQPARASLHAAEEAFRLQSLRFVEGAATTTDLIEAETGVTRARSAFAEARFDYFLAQAALAVATGRLPAAMPR